MNLTNMLVLTTIFISVMQTLPKTAYVKHIDIWLIFCQLIPFTEVLLITAAESLRPGNMSGLIPFNHHGQTRVIQVAPEEGGGVTIKAQEGKTGKSARDWIIFAGRLKTYRILAIPANLLISNHKNPRVCGGSHPCAAFLSRLHLHLRLLLLRGGRHLYCLVSPKIMEKWQL